MAYNWNTRRSIVIHAQKVEDSREILKQYLTRNNFNDVAAIDQLMSLGSTGKLSRRNTPRNRGISSFLTASNISKFVNALLGITSPSTDIIFKTY